MADEKRFAFIPLKYESKDRSLPGEVVVNDETGDLWIRSRKTGEMVSSTDNLERKIREIIDSGVTSMSYAYNHNRRVYRFYFENDVVRLDKTLNLDKSVAYYRIRDIASDGKYYVTQLTNVNNDAVTVFPFENNETYFVEFYNVKREMVSQMIFSAKYAPSVLVDGDPSKIISRIEIQTNKDFLYVGELESSLLVRIYAIYEDGSSKDITNYDNLILSADISSTKEGAQIISATYFYDTTHGQYLEAEKEIAVVVDQYAKVTKLVVVPRKVIRLNDGSRYIRLTIIGYFDDGTVRDVSDEVAVSNNFDPTLFNVPQFLLVKFNAGHLNVIEKEYTLLVKDDGSAAENIMFYRNNIMSVDGTFNPTVGAKYFKVRDAEDLSFYYTLAFNDIGYDAAYIEKPDILDRIHTGKNVIVELFNVEKELIDSKVFTMKYKENL